MFDVEYEVDQVLKHALICGASDIHIEPEAERLHVKLRIDGLLQSMVAIAKGEQEKVTNRIKLLSHMDIGERRLPQDGRLVYSLDGVAHTLRVASMPTIWGEKIVLRVQGRGQYFKSLADVGMSPSLERRVREVLQRPYGLFLVTGPTGSGKSTTLYTLLQEMNHGWENIICLENPVEYQIEGATQVEINEKSGLTFAAGLRAGLRQDPDIIMVGEIRDKETAQLAIQSALTGHKVLSTIHTNNAAGVITRLIDMGVEPFLVKAALVGALAQRLVRKPCMVCKGQDDTCSHCQGKGYKGRTALYELLSIPIEGMDWDHPELVVSPTLIESGQLAVTLGFTTVEELSRLGLTCEKGGVTDDTGSKSYTALRTGPWSNRHSSRGGTDGKISHWRGNLPSITGGSGDTGSDDSGI